MSIDLRICVVLLLLTASSGSVVFDQASHHVVRLERLLVVAEHLSIRNTHSQFLKSLEALGYSIDVRLASDKRLQLREWDAYYYDKVVLFAGGVTEFGGAFDTDAVLDFIDNGGDVLLVLDSDVSDDVRGLAAELGVDVEPRGSAVIDRVHYLELPPHDQSAVAAVPGQAAEAVLQRPIEEMGPVIFKGIAMTIPAESELVVPILSAPDTAFSAMPARPLKDDPSVAGHEAVLAAIVQTRGTARVAVLGSAAALSNAMFQSPVHTHGGRRFDRSGNQAFAEGLTRWVFHEHGVLRINNLQHHKVGEMGAPQYYRIMDDLDFSVDIQERIAGRWVPYRANDVQLEFVMLDPYVRTTLKQDGQGTYKASFRVPDVYGIYKFVIDYNRPGYSVIQSSTQVPVRPFRHDEFERFLTAAYPYYTSAMTTMAAFFILGFVFLYHK